MRWIVGCLLALTVLSSALAEEYSEAEEYFQQKKYQSAAIVLKNILQSDSANYSARLLLGRAYLEMLDAVAAIKELELARELSVSDRQYFIPLARAYLHSGQHEKVILLESQFQELGSLEQKSEFITITGYAYLAQNRVVEAEKSFNHAFSLDENVYSLIGLSRIEILQKDFDQARNYLERALEKQPDNLEALVALGEVFVALKRDDDALGYFARVLKSESRLDHVRIMRAEANIRRGDLLSARHDIELILQRNPKHIGAKIILARLQLQAADYLAAQVTADSVLRLNSQHLMAHFVLGATHYGLENFEQARFFLEKYIARRPLDTVAARLLAAVYLRLREPDKAVGLLAELDSSYQHKDPDLLGLLGRAYLEKGNYQKGIEILGRALEIDPDKKKARNMLLLGKLASGEMAQAAAELERRTKLPESTRQTSIMLIRTYLNLKEFEKAQNAVIDALKKYPEQASFYYLRGLVYESMQDTVQAKEAYQQALTRDAQHIQALSALANIESSQGNSQTAEDYFQKILEINPNHLNALMAKAQLRERDGDVNALIGWLVKARDRNPDSSIPVNFLVNHYLQTGQLDKASSEANSFYLNNKEKFFALTLMARTSLARQDYSSARSFLEQIRRVNPQDELHRFQLANLLIKMKDISTALVVLDEVLKINKTHLRALRLKFRLLLSQKEFAAASGLLQQVESYYPSHYLLYQLKGDLYAAQGQNALAIIEYKQGFDSTKKPYFANVLAQQYMSVGNVKEAAQILEQHLQRFPNDAQNRLFLASLYRELSEIKKAVSHYEMLLGSTPGDVIILNNLANLYLKTKDPRSLELAKKAYELADGRPEVADTYGWVLLHNGDKQKALILLQDAASQAPDNPDIRYHLAQAMYENGHYQRAKNELDRLLRDFTGFSEQASANRLSDKLSRQL